MNAVLDLPDEAATLEFAARLYRHLPPGCLVYLHGNLGAGKTTFVRGCLRSTGFTGAVKSPTFTLVEEYALPDRTLFHFDLYRLNDPEELEWMGIRDYLRPGATCFIEWPERGAGLLPGADLDIRLEILGPSRRATLAATSEQGRAILAAWAAG
ncbi:tRNA threonylcarbamoyladenosine biosynthesis protein TsaE [Methylomagnum ishizawai]|uniref:tRNA threonylcarbamoyladenosine biosynthesis protein TsaE n=1 Tax=Methylomagnum ishizawai TaxID=1760988 RepID=A0A1Y6CX81_9GAMM|nr:tRNA (adenosine(37)-N6)-threonylcarbamoyltransferase complex ATPase subunit type 1 TsaE [Methylomagnum ishizawai]SMF94850.1 tRNA threonylcarbamoyladenosine biosynthesis protein TsaE [Methylomagnum ishizawai]